MKPLFGLASRFPLIHFLAAYVAGLTLSSTAYPRAAFGLAGASLALAWAAWALGRRKASTVLLLVCMAALGVYRAQRDSSAGPEAGTVWPGVPDGLQTYAGVVASYPIETAQGSSFRVRLRAWKDKAVWRPISADARVFFNAADKVERGSEVRFQSSLKTPRNAGNPNEMDIEARARNRRIDLTGTVGKAAALSVAAEPSGLLRGTLNRIRNQALGRADIFMSDDNAALYRAMVLGDLGRLSEADRDAFRRCGVLHLLVVSGFHVGVAALICALAVGFLARRLRFVLERNAAGTVRTLAGLAGAALFCALTDLPVPTSRALSTVALLGVAVLLMRTRDVFSAWGITAFAFLLARPGLIADASFQLSFSAVGAIVAAVGIMPRRTGPLGVHRLAEAVASFLVVTLAAFAATAPIIAFHFHSISVWTPAANAILVPLLGLSALPAAFAGTFLSGPLQWTGDYLFCVFDGLASAAWPLVRSFAELPGSDVSVPRALWWQALYLIVGGVSAGAAWRLWIRNKRVAAIASGAASLFIAAWLIASIIAAERVVAEVHFLCVGQGDAAAIRTKGGKTILIDTGPGGRHAPDAGARVLIPFLRSMGASKVDLLILTHGDMDHVGGLFSLIEKIPVREVWVPAGRRGGVLDLIEADFRRRLVPVVSISSSNPPRDIDGVRLVVLHPPRGWKPTRAHDNQGSLVVRVDAAGGSILMAADVEGEGEKLLSLSCGELRADVLKVSHHGSQSSSSEDFLDCVTPLHAVISVGWKNRYGHPSGEVEDRLKRKGATVSRTDLCGAVRLQMRPGHFDLKTIRPCHDGKRQL